MRVALVTPRFLPYLGGVEAHVSALALRIAAAGHEVEVITQDVEPHRSAAEQISDHVWVRNFRAYGWNTPYTQAPGLWRYLHKRANKYDLVHAHSLHATPALAAAVSNFRTLIFTPHYNGQGHSQFTHMAHLMYRPAGQLIIRRSSAIICVSAAEASLLLRHFPSAAGKITVIPNGVDPADFAGTAYSTQGRTVLCVGRLEAYKNVDTVIHAVKYLPDDFRLVIVGDGRTKAKLERLSHSTKASDRIRFLGTIPRPELARWLRTASVFVAMSAREAFGITVLEALVTGAPVVASDIPAHREFLDRALPHSITFLPVGSPARTLASAIVAAAAQDRSGVTDIPTWDRSAEETLDLYESFATTGPHSRRLIKGAATPSDREPGPSQA